MEKKGSATRRADGAFVVGEYGPGRTVDGGAATFQAGAGANWAAALLGVFVVTLEAARLSTAETARCLC